MPPPIERERLESELRRLTIKPLIVDMRRKAEQIRQTELERALCHLGDLDPQSLAHIQHFSRSLVNKLLHEPTTRLPGRHPQRPCHHPGRS